MVAGPVFKTVTSAVKVTGVVAVAVLFTGLGSTVPAGAVTLTVLPTALVALTSTMPSTTIVILLAIPEFKLMLLRAILPAPLAPVPAAEVSQSAMPAAVQIQDIDAIPDGNTSVNVMPVVFDGPLLTRSI